MAQLTLDMNVFTPSHNNNSHSVQHTGNTTAAANSINNNATTNELIHSNITLNRILADLSSSYSDVRNKASIDLRIYIDNEYNISLQYNNIHQFINELLIELSRLVLCDNTNSVLGGISAIDQLINTKLEINEYMIIRFINILRQLFIKTYYIELNESINNKICHDACGVLGKLCSAAGTL